MSHTAGDVVARAAAIAKLSEDMAKSARERYDAETKVHPLPAADYAAVYVGIRRLHLEFEITNAQGIGEVEEYEKITSSRDARTSLNTIENSVCETEYHAGRARQNAVQALFFALRHGEEGRCRYFMRCGIDLEDGKLAEWMGGEDFELYLELLDRLRRLRAPQRVRGVGAGGVTD